jgi:uncharacterized protein (TIGR00255 family)
MQSMTGHGRASDPTGMVTIEIRTVNHRHLEIKLNSAMFSVAIEEVVTRELRRELHRGAVSVHLSIAAGVAASAEGAALDTARATVVFAELAALAKLLGTEPPTLATVVAQPGVWRVRPVTAENPQMDRAIATALLAAIAALRTMRHAEGVALRHDLALRLAQLREHAAAVTVLAAGAPWVLRQRLTDRLAKVADLTKPIDPARLAQEVALMVDRADISEELARLQSHFEQVEGALDVAEPAGRRLDFLVQEIGRELSTIGAKSASAEISHQVVAAKTVLEKLREQVQNVE